MYYSLKVFLKRFVNTPLIFVSFIIMTFFSWLIPFFDIVYVVFIVLICCVPIILNDAKIFLYLITFPLLANNNVDYKVLSLSLTMIISYASVFISVLLYLFLNRIKVIIGQLFYPVLVLVVLMLVSNLIFYLSNNLSNGVDFEYTVILMALLIVYIFLSTLFTEKGMFDKFCDVVGYFSVCLFLEIAAYYMMNPKEIFDVSLSNIDILGNSSKNIVSLVCMISLSLIGVSIYRKKWWFFFYFIVCLIGMVLLFSDVTIFGVLFFTIPIILISFRSYKKAGPYVYLFSLSFVVISLVFMLVFNSSFLDHVVDTFTLLNFGNNKYSQLYNDAVIMIKENPLIGRSSIGVIDKYGYLQSFHNDILTCLVYSGSFGLLTYIGHYVNFYFLCFTKKTSIKWNVFLIILMLNLFGLISQTFFDANLFFFVLLIASCYQDSKTPRNLSVNREYYLSKEQ